VRKKSVGIMKKISCVDFLLKKREKKRKECFFCGVFFREDNFRDIVREKKKVNLSMLRAMYQATNITKAW
jgi:hypothetical protein